MSKNSKIIKSISVIMILSMLTVTTVFAETTYIVNTDDFKSKGKIVYNDEASGDSVVIDSNDFLVLSDVVNQVNSDTAKTLEELSKEIDTLSQSVTDGKELIAKALSDAGTTTESDASFETMASNVTSMSESRYNAGIGYGKSQAASTLYTKLNALNGEINSLLSTTLSTSYSSTSTIDDIAAGIELTKNKLNDSLNQVFQSVNDGKKVVASAITNKGVSTAADATFQVMHDNIISMALKQYNTGYGNGYIDGQISKNTTGKVTYVKHYHTGNSSTYGGCFTIANYHRHVEGVCWYKCASHDKGMMVNMGSEHHSGKGDYTTYRCSVCGIRVGTWSGRDSAASILNGGGGYWGTDPVYRCGKTTNTIDSYSPSCGFTDGQILSATITY